jgi:hypothetical protein
LVREKDESEHGAHWEVEWRAGPIRERRRHGGWLRGLSRPSRSRGEERVERGDKVTERVENCEGVGEGGEGDLDSLRKAARPISDLGR